MVGRVGLEEDVQWGVVQWRLPEILHELRREQGGMQRCQCSMDSMSLCTCVHSAVNYIRNTKILYINHCQFAVCNRLKLVTENSNT